MPNRNADEELVSIMQDVMRQCHPGLVAAGVRVLLQTAHAALDKDGKPKGPALKVHGVPAHGCASIIKEKYRAAGLPDCHIELDGDNLPDWTEEKLLAVLDHELAHFEVCKDGEDQVKLDDCCRPKLKLRPHDQELGVIYSVAKRRGRAEPQVENFEHIRDVFVEMKVPFEE